MYQLRTLPNHPDKFSDVRNLVFLFKFHSEDRDKAGTLSGAITILFDTAVVAVTSVKILALLRFQKAVNALHKQSLINLLFQQGVCISFLCT